MSVCEEYVIEQNNYDMQSDLKELQKMVKADRDTLFPQFVGVRDKDRVEAMVGARTEHTYTISVVAGELKHDTIYKCRITVQSRYTGRNRKAPKSFHDYYLYVDILDYQFVTTTN